jgi:hypothetical protein
MSRGLATTSGVSNTQNRCAVSLWGPYTANNQFRLRWHLWLLLPVRKDMIGRFEISDRQPMLFGRGERDPVLCACREVHEAVVLRDNARIAGC